MFGILLIDKPQGITSHDVVYAMRRRFGTKRVGHAGTLDPMATGLLVVAIGPATRFLQYLALEPKEYVGTIRFGIETDTQDAEGNMIEERPPPSDLAKSIESEIPSFLGLIEQIPPMYSAVKKDGQPLYAYARKGIEVERRKRTVHLDRFEISNVKENAADFRVVCSGGTYVRTLAHDLGMAMGCGAHLSRLRRTGAGRFSIENAQFLDSVGPNDLIPLPIALNPMKLLSLDSAQAAEIRMGRQIEGLADLNSGQKIVLVDDDGAMIGIARAEEGKLQPECVLPTGVSVDS